MAAKKKNSDAPTPGTLAPPTMSMPGSVAPGSTFLPQSAGLLSTSLGPSSSYGPQLFLRIRVADVLDDVHVSSTLPVFARLSSSIYVFRVSDE